MPTRGDGDDEPLMNSSTGEPNGEHRRSSFVDKFRDKLASRSSVISVDVELNSMKSGWEQEEKLSAGQTVAWASNSWYTSIVKHDYLPGLIWLKAYPSHFGEWFFTDVIAGFSVAIMLIPMVLAYALLALGNNPPHLENGLYSAFMGVYLYSILGGSRVATVGPVALISLLIFSEIGTQDPLRLPELASAMGWYVGVFSLLIYFTRLGFLFKFISKPVLDGFVTGASLTIGFSQATNATGTPVAARGDSFIPFFSEFLPNLFKGQFSGHTFAVAASSVVFLKILEQLTKERFKDSWVKYIGLGRNFIMIVIATLIMFVVKSIEPAMTPTLDPTDPTATLGPENSKGPIQLVNEFPKGLPAFREPPIEDVSIVIAGALVITLVANLQHWSIVKPLSSWDGIECDVDGNQEAFALGVINLLNSYVQGFPICACFTRTVVNVSSGVKTMWSGVISGSLIILSLLFLEPLLEWIPLASLAAIILSAVPSLFRYSEFKKLYEKNNYENMFIFAAAFFTTALWGAVQGVGIGVAANLLVLIIRSIFPRIGTKKPKNKGYVVISTRGDINFLAGPKIYDNFGDVAVQFKDDPTLTKVIVQLEHVFFLDVDAAKAIVDGCNGIQREYDHLIVCFVGAHQVVKMRLTEQLAPSLPHVFLDSLEEAAEYRGDDWDAPEKVVVSKPRESDPHPPVERSASSRLTDNRSSMDMMKDPECDVICP